MQRQVFIKTRVSSLHVSLERTGAQLELLGYTCDEYRLADVPWVSKKRSHGAEPNAVFSVDDGLLGDDEQLSIKRRSSSSAQSVWPTPLTRRRWEIYFINTLRADSAAAPRNEAARA